MNFFIIAELVMSSPEVQGCNFVDATPSFTKYQKLYYFTVPVPQNASKLYTCHQPFPACKQEVYGMI